MTTDQIVDYVLRTPLNTNRAILTAMLEELEQESTTGQVRRDNDYNYDKVADVFVPLNGEICLVDTARDGLRAKCGDGKTLWKDLEYIDNYIIKGYYFNNNFYKEYNYQTQIQGAIQKIYIDLPSRTIHFYDGETFISTRGESCKPATEEAPGIVKLYQTIGNNTDGTMTQKAISKELEEKVEIALNMSEELIIFS